MFGLSFGEIVIIAIVALLLLGPDRLPDAAKTLGKGLREIRKATDDLKDQVEQEIYADVKKPPRPSLVPPVPAQPVPGPAGPPPVATAENVPGLDAAIFEPAAAQQPGPEVAAPPPEPQRDAAAHPGPAAQPGTVAAPGTAAAPATVAAPGTAAAPDTAAAPAAPPAESPRTP